MKKINFTASKSLTILFFITAAVSSNMCANNDQEAKLAESVEQLETDSVLADCQEAVRILDSLVEQRPAVLHLIRMTAHRAQKILLAIQAYDQNEINESFLLTQQKEVLMAPVSKFLKLVYDNGSMVLPIVEALLGAPSVYFPEFLEVAKDDVDDHFEKTIDSLNVLRAFACEVHTVCSGLDNEEVFIKGYPAYRAYLTELKKERTSK